MWLTAKLISNRYITDAFIYDTNTNNITLWVFYVFSLEIKQNASLPNRQHSNRVNLILCEGIVKISIDHCQNVYQAAYVINFINFFNC